MHLKIEEQTEWDAAGEVRDPSCPKHDNSLFYCISVMAWPVRLFDRCVCVQKRSVYGHNLIYKYHRSTRAFPFLHKGPSWQPVLSLKYRMSAGRAGARASDRRRQLKGYSNQNQITFIVTSPQHKFLGEWNSYERAPDSAKKTTTIDIWTVHIYRLYRRQCAKYTYIYSVHIVYYKDILNYQLHIIHRMGTSTLCTLSIHYVVYT